MTPNTTMNFPTGQYIIQYKDEGKSYWLDFKTFLHYQFDEACKQLQSLDPNKYRLIVRSEAIINPVVNSVNLIEFKQKIDKLLTYSPSNNSEPNMQEDKKGTWINLIDLYKLIDSLGCGPIPIKSES